MSPTPKQSISEKRLAANRANAARANGPRTDEGKARSAQNARKHGFTAASSAPNTLRPSPTSSIRPFSPSKSTDTRSAARRYPTTRIVVSQSLVVPPRDNVKDVQRVATQFVPWPIPSSGRCSVAGAKGQDHPPKLAAPL